MKLVFRGWSREVFAHNHDVVPAALERLGYKLVTVPEAEVTNEGVRLRGKISNVALSGDFRLETILSGEDVESIVAARIRSDPIESAEWLGRLQAQAIAEALRQHSVSADRKAGA